MTGLRTTRLHTLLRVDSDLDYDMLKQAVAAAVREDEQLDWKRLVRFDDERELAKDVAAMANSHGGLLIYGIAQNNSTSAAAKILPVDLGDRDVTRYHQAIDRQITPKVAGLQVLPLPEPGGDGTRGLLAVQVPESPDAPHLVGEPSRFGVPYQVGASTAWMTEPRVAVAYQNRWNGQSAGQARLAELMEQTTRHLDRRSAWLVGAVCPASPVEGHSPPDRDAARGTADLAVRIGGRMFSALGLLTPRRPLVVVNNNSSVLVTPRPGLRRWVFADRGRNGSENHDVLLHLELHYDGSLVLATTAHDSPAGPAAEPFNWAEETKITGFAIDLIATAAAHARNRHVDSRSVVRATLVRFDERPFALAAYERAGGAVISHLSQPGWTNEVTEPETVSVDIPPLDSNIDGDPERPLPDLVRTLAGDIVSQFGFSPDSLSLEPIPRP